MTDLDPGRWRKVQPILDRVLEVPPRDRRPWLEKACAGDERLRADVEAVLAADEEAGGVLDAPTGEFIDWFLEEVRQQSSLSMEQEPGSPIDVGQIASNVLTRRSRARAPGRTASSNPPHGGTARFLPGAMLASRYRVVTLLGRGGMGEVYRADDLKLGQGVALKFLPARVEDDPAHLERLLNEVRLARQVAHPSVCRVYDVGETEGRHFISMEYVDGEDLSSLLKRIGRLPNEKALRIAQQLCAGLAAAHEQGILHRDLKPANVMLDGRGRVRIADFGLAAGGVVEGQPAREGTKAYMAPEQLAGLEATKRSDLYALGLVLYEVFTGRRAFQADSEQDLRRLQEQSSPARPSSLVEGIGTEVERTILTCLEKDPALRPASALSVAAMLPGGDPLAAALAAGETPSPEMVAAAGAEGALAPATAWSLFGAAVAGVLAAVVLTAWSQGLDKVPLTRSPEALREQARTIARTLGRDVSPLDDVWWIDVDEGYADRALSGRETPSLGNARPAAARFYYRGSPRPLVAVIPLLITKEDPPPFASGETYIVLDPNGRLLEFSVQPHQIQPEDAEPTSPPDWSALLALAFPDPGMLREVEPRWTPDVASDARRAWEGTEAGIPVRIEAAAWRGSPVWMRTVAPWERAERDAAVRPSQLRVSIVFIILVVITTIMFAALARRNIRLGRSDRRGAARVGAAVFVGYALSSALCFRWTADATEIWMFLNVWLGPAFFNGAAAWLYYLSIEPFLRRRWPHRLMAWTRLLEGRWADPLVGKELLVGIVTGVLVVTASAAGHFLSSHQSVEALPILMGRLAGGPEFWGTLASYPPRKMIDALGVFATLLVLRIALRRDAAAWIALGVIGMLMDPKLGNPLVAWSISAITAAILILGGARVGLLALATALGVGDILLAATPLTLEMNRWYAWRTAAVAALILGLAFWGFRAAMGRRRIFSPEVLDV